MKLQFGLAPTIEKFLKVSLPVFWSVTDKADTVNVSQGLSTDTVREKSHPSLSTPAIVIVAESIVPVPG